MNQNGKVVKGLKVTSIDPTVSFGHGKHIYLMVFSASILIFIILPPIIVLIAYPTRLFTRLQERFSSRVNLAIGTFVNTFQGCYKDGLNGTRDYRAMSGGILASIVIMVILWCSADMLVEVSDRQPIIAKQLTIWSLIALTVMMATLRPYKSETANHTAVCLTALLYSCCQHTLHFVRYFHQPHFSLCHCLYRCTSVEYTSLYILHLCFVSNSKKSELQDHCWSLHKVLQVRGKDVRRSSTFNIIHRSWTSV